jgi:hypothetical protein
MLHVFLLGEQVITDDATGPGRTRSSRTLALLTFLVVHAGSPQTRQRLAALFWPDSTDEQALTNLRRELHHLRNALGGEPALVVTAKDLCWRATETCRVDVRAFGSEREAALAAAVTAHTRHHIAQSIDWFLVLVCACYGGFALYEAVAALLALLGSVVGAMIAADTDSRWVVLGVSGGGVLPGRRGGRCPRPRLR